MARRTSALLLLLALFAFVGAALAQPYGACIPVLPGRLEAENFDLGGEGVGYHDLDPANQGGQYRLTEGVDIGRSQDTDNGYSVGWAYAGEWLNYTVYVPTATSYRLDARVASQGAGGIFHFELNGTALGSPVTVPDTGSWAAFTTVGTDVQLPAGLLSLRLVLDSNGATGAVANFNYFDLAPAGMQVGAATVPPGGFALEDDYSRDKFFGGYDWFTAPDPTHGYVQFVDYNTAQTNGLARQTPDGQIYMGADNTTIAGGAGRQAIRLSSKKSYNGGLFVIDLEHMPTGCGTWPAFWLVGPNWPAGGEIDIIEGVNRQSTVLSTLHTGDGCGIFSEPESSYTGSIVTKNCYIYAPGQGANQGCSIWGAPKTMGTPFNAAKGGVFATLWDDTGIRHWFWNRTSIPADVAAATPEPSTWGTPYSRWNFGNECPSWHFSNNNIIFDLTFCGDWAGNTFGGDCPNMGSCTDFVRNNPSAFSEAYWLVNSVRVYQKTA